MKYFDFFKKKPFGVFGLFTSCFPTVEIYHLIFFSTYLLIACWNCEVFYFFCNISFGYSFAQLQNNQFGVCVPASCVSALYALSGRDWRGMEDEDFSLKTLKQEINGNPWKAAVEFGLPRSRCNTGNLQGIEMPREQNEVLVWCVWLNCKSLCSISITWTAAIACCRPAGICKEQVLQQSLAMRH